MTPNRDRQRTAARARLEREMSERAETARQRRRRNQAILGVSVAVVLVAAGVVVAVLAFGGDDDGKKPTAGSSSAAACVWTPRVDPSAPADQPKPAVKDVGTPPKTGEPRSGKQVMTMNTSLGVIKIEMDTAKTPCTSASFTYLAGKKFFDGTSCHRLAPAIGALQCGDPQGDGTGGPSYEFGDENLPVNQRPAYPKGYVAMANGGPGTNGSQFFFLYKDADLDPNYTVFGRVTEGMDVIEKVGAAGDDGAYDPSPGGGHPKTKLTFTSITVSPPAA